MTILLTLGPDHCPHVWRWVKDWEGDPDVINGTRDLSHYVCQKCGVEANYGNADDEDIAAGIRW